MGEITINGTELSQYGVMMLAGSYTSLLMPAQTKDWVANDNPRKDGTEYLVPSETRVKERDVSLIFAIEGNDKTDFLSKYNSFISLLQGGISTFYIPDIGKYYHLKYETCTEFNNYGLKACDLVVKFTEPNPANNGSKYL